ncbi:hypothetical protein HPB51_024512 [Rhipicephalus microplus]|uniref:Uncharacterized protein n=1 Tax=Rhipicephalus microplus TaxID=6941 RepID=A0A9J6EDM5_RHIMP|nr:hypothetical protein HPB51_024512 [Rhipicephalus microplus]
MRNVSSDNRNRALTVPSATHARVHPNSAHRCTMLLHREISASAHLQASTISGYAQQDPNASPGGGVYPTGGTYVPPQSAAPYMGPVYSPSQPGLASPPMYGPQPYAAVPYDQPAMSPMTPYDPAYASYMYGLQAPQRQYLIQAPPRRKGVFTTDNLLTVLMVGDTLVLAVFALLLVVTVVVPKMAYPEQPVDAPQVSTVTKEELTESKLNAAGTEQERKNFQMAGHIKRRAKA